MEHIIDAGIIILTLLFGIIWLLKTIVWVAKHVEASEEARKEYLERERLDREGRDL